MPTESIVGIVIQARDEATRVLQQVRGELGLRAVGRDRVDGRLATGT